MNIIFEIIKIALALTLETLLILVIVAILSGAIERAIKDWKDIWK